MPSASMSKSHHCQIELPKNDGQEPIIITLVYLPSINLYVITDARGFGQNWIRVSYLRNVYDVKLLLGVDDQNDTMTSIARFLAEPIIKHLLSKDDEQQLLRVDEICIYFSISLRKTANDPTNVRFIREQIEKYFSEQKN